MHNFWDARSQRFQATGKPSSKHSTDSYNARYVRRSTPKPWWTKVR